MGSGVRRISDTVLLVSPVVKQTANDQTWWVADSWAGAILSDEVSAACWLSLTRESLLHSTLLTDHVAEAASQWNHSFYLDCAACFLLKTKISPSLTHNCYLEVQRLASFHLSNRRVLITSWHELSRQKSSVVNKWKNTLLTCHPA